MNRHLQVLPVIQPGPFHLTAVKRKAQGPDKMQVGIRGQAGAADISGIPMDFRRNQNNVAFKLVASAIKAAFVQL